MVVTKDYGAILPSSLSYISNGLAASPTWKYVLEKRWQLYPPSFAT